MTNLTAHARVCNLLWNVRYQNLQYFIGYTTRQSLACSFAIAWLELYEILEGLLLSTYEGSPLAIGGCSK